MELTTFRGFDFSFAKLPIFTVYSNPSDHPNQFVARMFDVDKTTPYFVLGDTELEVVNKLPQGLHRLARDPFDDPVIVCVYL